MPIQFRCHHCNQKLSITRRKAGNDVKCPACAKPIRVPTVEEATAALAAKRAVQQSRDTIADDSDVTPGTNQAIEPDATLRDGDLSVRPAPEQPEPEVDQTAISSELIEAWKQGAAVDPWNTDEEEDEEEEEFHLRSVGGEEDELDMTPMVDVTFLLLIFFMITASFSLQKSMQTEAPEPEEEGAAQTITVQDIEEASIIVAIDGEDNITVDDEPISGLGQLIDVLAAKMVAEQPPRNDMLIEADYLASHGVVVSVTDAGMQAGMQNIRRVSRSSQD